MPAGVRDQEVSASCAQLRTLAVGENNTKIASQKICEKVKEKWKTVAQKKKGGLLKVTDKWRHTFKK